MNLERDEDPGVESASTTSSPAIPGVTVVSKRAIRESTSTEFADICSFHVVHEPRLGLWFIREQIRFWPPNGWRVSGERERVRCTRVSGSPLLPELI